MATNDDTPPKGQEEQFREAMKVLRAAQDLNQTDLARKVRDAGLAFHQSTIAKIESGARPVRMDEAFAIAKALDSSVLEMIRGPVRAESSWALRIAHEEVLEAYGAVKDATHRLVSELSNFEVALDDARKRGVHNTFELTWESVVLEHDPISAVQEGIGLFAADLAVADVYEKYRIDKHTVGHVRKLYREALEAERSWHKSEDADG